MPEQSQTDHDLLIELKTQMITLRDDIKELKELLADKNDDHEKRIRFLERWVWTAMGGLIILQLSLKFLI